MGDITGRPKAPPQQQVVYVPQYISTPSPTPTAPPSGGAGTNPDAPPSEAEVVKQREKSLLSRGRSRVGTILTSFRGLLAPIETNDSRKTLLGE